MRQILTTILALFFIASNAIAQNMQRSENSTPKRVKTEIMAHISSLPGVSVAYLTKSMLQKLPKDKSESPLSVLADKGGVESIRVFQLGSAETEAEGKKLIDAYISDITEYNYAELLVSQKNGQNEMVIYGFHIHNDTSYYRTILIFSKAEGKKTVLIILSGKIHENTLSELIDSFSK